MRLMRWFGVVLVWSLGVTLVASVSWVAINSAGRQVVEDSVVTRIADGGGSVADPVMPSPLPSTSSITTSATPQPFSTESGAARSRPTGGDTPVPIGSDAPTGIPSLPDADPTTPVSPASPTSAPTQGPKPVSDSRATSGGYVWMECTGTRVSNALAQPSSGWSARWGQHSSGDVEIYFTHNSKMIEVTGTCPGGWPHFEVKSSHDGHEHGDD